MSFGDDTLDPNNEGLNPSFKASTYRARLDQTLAQAKARKDLQEEIKIRYFLAILKVDEEISSEGADGGVDSVAVLKAKHGRRLLDVYTTPYRR